LRRRYGFFAQIDSSNKIQRGNTYITQVTASGKLTTADVSYPNVDGTSGQVSSGDGAGQLY
jgi:hypothetical protein